MLFMVTNYEAIQQPSALMTQNSFCGGISTLKYFSMFIFHENPQ